MNDKPALSFEKALAELTTIVKNLEDGALNLEDALSMFERGVHLTKHCQQALTQAEQKITQLTEDGSFVPLDTPSHTQNET